MKLEENGELELMTMIVDEKVNIFIGIEFLFYP